VLKGSFDKYVESTKIKKGTAEVDSAFLKEIELWREMLARNLALRNPELTQRELNFAVQRIIDRVIFLRICEDRGIEGYGRLMALLNGAQVYERLSQLFYEADDRYNSGLFHFRREKDRKEPPDELTQHLKIDDRVLKEIIKNLYYPDSPYEFSVLPADILGQVYEQFLGKVIRLTEGHRAVVEDKPEVKKAGGVYYTPTYIVDYIVKNTVGKLVGGKTPKQISGVGARHASPLRILDPACGSGSFLIGTYQLLLDYHRDWYVKDGPEKWRKARSPVLYQAAGGDWRLTTAERRRILLNNIFGVDIDPQAVEVTKLSLLLKVLEGENEQTILRQLKMFQERALPDLGNNIKCGNSLIGPDFYDGKQMSLFDEEERYRVNVFDWEKEFPEIMKAGGFDAVIGNPPYVLLSVDIFNESIMRYLSSYEVAQYKSDLFHLFIEMGIRQLRAGGYLGYITPNTWFTLQFGTKLREFVLRNSEIEEVVVFNHHVFKNADVHTGLLFVRNMQVPNYHKIAIKHLPFDFNVDALYHPASTYVVQTSWLEDSEFRFETRQCGKEGNLVKRIVDESPGLEEVARASLGIQAYNSLKHSREEIEARVFHAPQKLSAEYLPELAGTDVGRYMIERKKGQWIKYGPWLHDYRTMDWFTGPRILIREIPGRGPYRIYACYTEATYCNYKTILNVNPSPETEFSMKYLLGILNSRLLSFLYPRVSTKIVAMSFPRLSVKDIKRLPIRRLNLAGPLDKARHDKMVELVEQMLSLHKQLTAAKTDHDKTTLQRQIDATDQQIDRLVYELYGLTEEEIKIVEQGL